MQKVKFSLWNQFRFESPIFQTLVNVHIIINYNLFIYSYGINYNVLDSQVNSEVPTDSSLSQKSLYYANT